MKVLFIGGSGNISTACSRLAAERGIELVHFNRGLRKVARPQGVRGIRGDVGDRRSMARALASEAFDVVVNWIVFDQAQAAADLAMFAGKVKQYVFISTATVYQKSPRHYLVTEVTPLANPFWEYSQKKIAVERLLVEAHHRHGFPVSIVRPSFTYRTGFPLHGSPGRGPAPVHRLAGRPPRGATPGQQRRHRANPRGMESPGPGGRRRWGAIDTAPALASRAPPLTSGGRWGEIGPNNLGSEPWRLSIGSSASACSRRANGRSSQPRTRHRPRCTEGTSCP